MYCGCLGPTGCGCITAKAGSTVQELPTAASTSTTSRCEDGESASIIRTCMELEWSSVKTGQKVKVKMKGKFVGVVIENRLNWLLMLVTAKAIIVRPSENSPIVKKFSSDI